MEDVPDPVFSGVLREIERIGSETPDVVRRANLVVLVTLFAEVILQVFLDTSEAERCRAMSIDQKFKALRISGRS